jgi:hypothetical protein
VEFELFDRHLTSERKQFHRFFIGQPPSHSDVEECINDAGPSRRRSLSTLRSGTVRCFSSSSVLSIDSPFDLSIQIRFICKVALVRMDWRRMSRTSVASAPGSWGLLKSIKSSWMAGGR